MITHCPICNSELIISNGFVEKHYALHCRNPKVFGYLEFYIEYKTELDRENQHDFLYFSYVLNDFWIAMDTKGFLKFNNHGYAKMEFRNINTNTDSSYFEDYIEPEFTPEGLIQLLNTLKALVLLK